jgi:REP element-mobilizing transposase RayT
LGIEGGALFHIRIALDRQAQQQELTNPKLAPTILDSANFYQQKERWNITLFLLMPDHLHGLLAFARDESMSEVVRAWKRFHARTNHVVWQEGYFDHRLRNDERGEQLGAKMNYIRQNSVAAGLWGNAQEWPWVIDPFANLQQRVSDNAFHPRIAKGGSTSPEDDVVQQRVDDNAFHLCAKLPQTRSTFRPLSNQVSKCTRAPISRKIVGGFDTFPIF